MFTIKKSAQIELKNSCFYLWGKILVNVVDMTVPLCMFDHYFLLIYIY
jgi:hypothetical protein